MPARIRAPWQCYGPWRPPLILSAFLILVMAKPALLVPLAQAYAALCERFPILALVTNHAPALPMALLLSLAIFGLVVGGWTGITALLVTLRFNRRLHLGAAPLCPRLERLGGALGLTPHLTYLSAPDPLACCYGLLRPRIAVTAGLVERLDDEELAGVLGHEREHLRRRDPLRYLVLAMLAAAAVMFPVATALRQRVEARMELAADRAALALVPRSALAGALLATAAAAQTPPGIAGLTATEARIAHLAGRSEMPTLPAPALQASLGVAAIVLLATIHLAALADLVRMTCPFCPWLP